MRKRALKTVATAPVRLRIGVGEEEGYTKVMSLVGEADTVDIIYSAFHFHRLVQCERFVFMNEAARLLKPGGQLILVVPHARSDRSINDPLAQWPPLCESSFLVYSRQWREQEQMTNLPLACDFGSVYGYGHTTHADLIARNEAFVAHAKEHETNWVLDLHVTLTKER